MLPTTTSKNTLFENILVWIAPIHQFNSFGNTPFFKTEAYWQIGQLIQIEKEQLEPQQFKILAAGLARQLKTKFDKTYTLRWITDCCQLFVTYPDRSLLANNLSWSHYRMLIKIESDNARQYYTQQASQHHWTTAYLKRQISMQHYERLLEQAHPFDAKGQANPLFLLKEMYLFEFLQFANDSRFLEKDLEDALAQKLQHFLMELGNGFAFVAQQKRAVTATGKTFYMDLVFYHYVLKCFVVIELKKDTLTHRDIGQLDMYVRMFDHRWKDAKDNPTIGILLCKDIDPTIQRYSALHDNPQLHAACYRFDTPKSEVLDPRVKAALEKLKF